MRNVTWLLTDEVPVLTSVWVAEVGASEPGVLAEVFFYSQQLVVLGQVASRWSCGLNLMTKRKQTPMRYNYEVHLDKHGHQANMAHTPEPCMVRALAL